ncbi:MAG TPA: hypothetical protein VHH88_07680, partial [Verrucomicrobiae bacterium]|nr:hypothetical protein [Verrucomicrobiae bacterium]
MIPPILADLDPADFTDDSDLVVPLGGDVKYLIIAVAIIVSAVVIWAIFIRKPRDERARLYRDMASASDREASPGPAPGSTEQRR